MEHFIIITERENAGIGMSTEWRSMHINQLISRGGNWSAVSYLIQFKLLVINLMILQIEMLYLITYLYVFVKSSFTRICYVVVVYSELSSVLFLSMAIQEYATFYWNQSNFWCFSTDFSAFRKQEFKCTRDVFVINRCTASGIM